MNRLTPKKLNFAAGKKVFVSSEGEHLISEGEVLPEGYLLGADLPQEEGVYVLETSYGAFVFKVSADTVSTLWSTWSGSSPDGQFFYNNDIAPSEVSSLELVYDSPGSTNRLNQNVGGLVDFGEFFISTYTFSTGKADVLKIAKDFSTVDILSFPELSGVNLFDFPVVSKELDGVLFFEDTADGQLVYGTMYLVNVYEETVSQVELEVGLPPNFTDAPRNRLSGVIEYGGGKVAVLREREVFMYQYQDGTLSYLYSRVWSSPEENWSGLLYPVYPLLSIKQEGDTLYLIENNRIRAIDTSTDEMRWEFTDAAGGNFSEDWATSRITGNIFNTRWPVGGATIFEHDASTGSVVNSWNVSSEFTYWGEPVPIHIEDSGKIHIRDGDRITIFDPAENTFTIVVSGIDVTTSGNFGYWGKSFRTKNGYMFTPLEGGQAVHWYNMDTYVEGVFTATGLGAWDNFIVFSEDEIYYNAINSIQKVTFTL